MPVYDPFNPDTEQANVAPEQEIYDPFSVPSQPGILSRMGSDIGSGFNAAWDTLNRPTPSGEPATFGRKVGRAMGFAPQAGTPVQAVGNVAGGFNQAIGTGIGGVAQNALMRTSPEFQQGLAQTITGFANPNNYLSPTAARMIGQAASKGSEYARMLYGMFDPETQRNLEAAKEIGEAGLMVYPAIAGRKIAAEVGTASGGVVRDLAGGIVKVSPEAVLAEQNAIIKNGINKTFLNKGIWRSGWQRTQDYYNTATDAVRSIYKNQNWFKDANGRGIFFNNEKGTYHTLPQNMEQFAEAINIGKRNTFNLYDSIVRSLGSKVPPVTTKNSQDLLDMFVEGMKDSKLPQAESASRAALKLKAQLQSNGGVYKNLNAVQKDIAMLNAAVAPYIVKGTVDNPIAQMYLGVLKQLRTDLNVSLGSLGPEYASLKKQWGALNEIDNEVLKKTLTLAGKGEEYVSTLTDVVSGSMLLKSIMSGKLSLAGAAIAGHEIARIKNKIKDPNRIIRKMFEEMSNLDKKYNTQGPITKGIQNTVITEQDFKPNNLTIW